MNAIQRPHHFAGFHARQGGVRPSNWHTSEIRETKKGGRRCTCQA